MFPFLSTIWKDFTTEVHKLFGGSHVTALQTAITDALEGLSLVNIAAAAAGAPAAFTAEVGKLTDALTSIEAGVANASTASTLSEVVAGFTAAVQSLVSSGDIGIKDPKLQASITTALSRVTNVVGAIEASASTAPAAA